MGGVGGQYSPPTPPKKLVLRDCTVNHPLYAIALPEYLQDCTLFGDAKDQIEYQSHPTE
jgi:hypothetical protein